VKILVMNVNTTASMTETMREGAQSVARPGTEIIAMEPTWGPPSVEGYYESYISAAAILDRLHEIIDPSRPGGPVAFDALIWAGFGEHGKEAAMELLDVPVINITDAAAHLACLIGRKYGVVTTLHRAIGQIEENLLIAGLMEKCASVRASGLGVLELEEDPERTVQCFVETARQSLADGAEVLLLGCGGMSGMQERLTKELGVPVVDGVAAAVKLAESLVDLGLTTSKVSSYAAPLPKPRAGWPIHAR
jgi:allantoin racemase